MKIGDYWGRGIKDASEEAFVVFLVARRPPVRGTWVDGMAFPSSSSSPLSSNVTRGRLDFGFEVVPLSELSAGAGRLRVGMCVAFVAEVCGGSGGSPVGVLVEGPARGPATGPAVRGAKSLAGTSL